MSEDMTEEDWTSARAKRQELITFLGVHGFKPVDAHPVATERFMNGTGEMKYLMFQADVGFYVVEGSK